MADLNSKTQLVGHITSNNLPINVQIVATGAQGKPGIRGEPGRTPEILAIQEEDGITITVDGEAIATIKDGKDGKDGVDGTVSFDELTPEQRESLRGEQGIQGEKGEKGDKGDKGERGEKGEDGYTPVKGVDYFDGEDGYTPVKGVDYFTDAEISAIESAAASKVVVPTKVSELENDSGFAKSSIVSDEWNGGRYEAGAYCIENNVLYRCLITHSGQRPSTSPRYWAATSVSAELSQKTIKRITKSYSNVKISSSGSAKLDDYTGVGLTSTDKLISINVSGWSGMTADAVVFYKGYDGVSIYAKGTANATISAISVEYWYFN